MNKILCKNSDKMYSIYHWLCANVGKRLDTANELHRCLFRGEGWRIHYETEYVDYDPALYPNAPVNLCSEILIKESYVILIDDDLFAIQAKLML